MFWILIPSVQFSRSVVSDSLWPHGLHKQFRKIALKTIHFKMDVCMLKSFSHVSLPPYGLQPARLLLSMGFSRQEYWSGLPCPSSEDLSYQGIELSLIMLPALAGRFFTLGPPGKPSKCILIHRFCLYLSVAHCQTFDTLSTSWLLHDCFNTIIHTLLNYLLLNKE